MDERHLEHHVTGLQIWGAFVIMFGSKTPMVEVGGGRDARDARDPSQPKPSFLLFWPV